MPKLFSVDVLICGTAYIIADTAEQAAAMAQEAFASPEDASVSSRTTFGEIPVSGYQFEGVGVADDLPPVSLSPALTFCGAAAILDKLNPADFAADGLELQHDSEESEHAED